jgi:uncharacterized membrane protein YfcA
MPVYVFSVAALLTGVMSGLFGIGGGLLLNPVLLQTGVPPKVSASSEVFLFFPSQEAMASSVAIIELMHNPI